MIPILGFSEPFSSISHLLAAVISFVAGIFLLLRGRGSALRIVSLYVFTFSLIFLFSMSGVYHLLEPGGLAREVLRRLDHAAIWVLIAGTFTPIHVILFRGPWRWGVLLFVWSIAITGLVLEVVFFDSFPEWMPMIFFLGLGWFGAATGIKFRTLFRDKSIALLISGGLCYSVGAIIDYSKWPDLVTGVIGAHEIFHIFVMLGALFHWLFIFHWAGHPVFNAIVFHITVFPDQRHVATAKGERLQFEANSLAELKALIRMGVTNKYHSSIQPEIRLKYFHEEIF